MLPKPNQIKSVLMIGGLIVGGVLLYKANKKAKVFVTQTVNPASDNNFIYNWTKNDKGEGLGARVFHWFN